jgi:1-acyl-sn-glycerol-3-phosphate acyltransferase
MRPFAIDFAPGETPLTMWARRIISLSGLLALAALAWLAAPLWLLLGLLADLMVGPRWRWSRARTVGFLMLFLACEVVGVVAAAVVWMSTFGGRIVSHQRYLDYNAACQRWWSEALLRGTFRLFSIGLEVEGQEVAASAPFLLLVRHVSTADTVLAASLVANHHRILLSYVVKRELLWDPCLDIFGHRLPVAYIDRHRQGGEAAAAGIADLARSAAGRTGVLIYPEGTRFSEAKRAHYIRRLRETGKPELAEMAEGMKHVIAPRPRGVLALLEAAPQLDIVVLAHLGLEGASSFSEFFAGGLVDQRVRVKLWRISCSEIPTENRERWLFDRWAEVDNWVASHQ